MQIRLLTALTLSRSLPCGFLYYACFGREKEASDLTSEVSADLSDFSTSPDPLLKGGEEGW
jgi:hypothetical protein